ncbi:MAG: UDP-N-acetylmuramoyl-L-alanine--D-glutamate ligase [Clostridiales bacterium]
MWQGKRVYLIGAGLSGLAAAGWLLEQKALVCLNDKKAFENFDEAKKRELLNLEAKGAILDLGKPCDPLSFKAEFVVASPGVPLDQAGIAEAKAKGIPVTNEIELGWQVSRASIVAITGSNGKTTVTSLVGRMLEAAGFDPFVGGNIGTPFILAAPGLNDRSWAVLELSSFQLEGVLSLKPKVAVFLNLTPDHLDWHKSFANYEAAKWRIARFQGPEDWLILNYDDALLRAEGHKKIAGSAGAGAGQTQRGPRILWFSTREKPAPGLWIDQEGWVRFCPVSSVESGGADPDEKAAADSEGIKVMPAAEFALPGRHNQENLLAALAACLVLDVPLEVLRQAAAGFKAVEHRMEVVGEWQGVLYVNDSKATNPDSAIKSLDAYERPILLIAGGDGKNAPFKEVAEKIAEKAKLVVLIGKDGDKMKEALLEQGFDSIRMAATLEEAVDICCGLALPGDLVLLAPACASTDMFTNYAKRGEAFKAAVLRTQSAIRRC